MTAPCPTFGFLVDFEFRPGLGGDGRHAFWTEWRAFLDRHALYSERSDAGAAPQTLVVMGDGAQATESDRAATRQWLATRSELSAWSVGGLVDVMQLA